jgi:hypothetical protein
VISVVVPEAVFDPWDHVLVTVTDAEIRVEPVEGDTNAARALNMIAIWLVDDLKHRMGSR